MKCGLYELDITPNLGSDVPGQLYSRTSDGIRERLYVHASYFCNDDARKAVLISVDVVALPSLLAEEVRTRIADRLHMKKACVLVAATHSHTAGPVHTWGEFSHRDDAYLEFLKTRIIDAAVLAEEAQREVTIGFAKGSEDRIAFYRDFVMGDGSYRTNPGMGGEKKPFGVIDPEVVVLRIDNADGTPYGAVINYACHCDCVGGTRYSSDYPGAMKATLRKMFGDGFIPVFINGFCGNINHCDYDKGFHQFPDHYRRMGRMLAAEVIRTREIATIADNTVLAGAEEYLTLPTREPTQEQLDWADSVLRDREASGADTFFAREARRYASLGVQQVSSIIQAIRIGDLAIFALPGEVYVEFARYLKEHSPGAYAMTANLSNGSIGYVPIRELFQPGIYEARLCSSSNLTPDAGYIMSEHALALAERLFNPEPPALD